MSEGTAASAARLASGSWRRPASWRVFALRLVHLNFGLTIFGLSIALMLTSNVGLPAWDVFHQGVALQTPLTIGQAMVLAGLVLIVIAWVAAHVQPGIGTVFNMIAIGLWVDLFLSLRAFPVAEGGAYGWTLFTSGLALNGLATGLYITAGLGAGPRDSFALALASLLGIQVRRARMSVELVVLGTGWLLGGTVGLGTVAFALAIGPLMQSSLHVLRGIASAYERLEAPFVGRLTAKRS